jgi:cellulose synthase operon protein C
MTLGFLRSPRIVDLNKSPRRMSMASLFSGSAWAGVLALSLSMSLLMTLAGCSRESSQVLIASGKKYVEAKDPRAAIIQFKAALQADAQSGEARYLLGQTLLDSGDAIGATTELQKALDLKYSVEKVVPAMARALLLSGDFVKLTSQLGSVVLEEPAAAASLRTSVAAAWFGRGERAMADDGVRSALDSVPNFGPALTLRTRMLASERKFDEAMAITEKLLKDDPLLQDAWQLKGDILLAGRKDSKGAEEAFRKALAIDKTYIPAHLAIISSKLSERDMAGAKAQSDQLRGVLPNHPQSMFVDAAVAFSANDMAKARELSQQLMRMAPTNLAVLQLAGSVESQLGSLGLAESLFGKALQIAPELNSARRGLAQTYLRMGEYLKVLQTLQPMLGSEGTDAEAQALAGEAAMRMGNARASEAFYNRAAQLDPGDARVGTAVALSRLSRGEIGAGFAELQTLASKTTDLYADQALVSSLLKRRDLDAALKAALAMQKKQPDSTSVLETLGRVYIERKEYPAARTAFEQALKKDPGLFVAVAALASVDMLENKPDDAQKRLEATVQADARNTFALMALAELRARRGAPTEEVRKLLADAIVAAPSDPSPRLQLMEFHLRNRQYRDALAAAQEATIALPTNVAVLDAAGRAQMEGGNTEQALNTFRKMAALDQKSAVPYTRLADIYRLSGKRSEAEVALKKALELEPGLQLAQGALADLLFSTGRRTEALNYILKLRQDRPDEVGPYLIEGAYHRRVRAIDAAVAAYRAGVEATNDASIARELYITLISNNRVAEGDRFGAGWIKSHPTDAAFEFLLADLSIRRKQYDVAEAQLKRVVSQFPDNALAFNNLAWTQINRGKPGAVANAQRAVDLAPSNPSMLDTLALALATEKKYADALAVQKRAVALAPNQNALRMGLARLATQAGDKTLARAELERLKALGAAYDKQDEVSKLLGAL